ncbi:MULTISPECIES: MucR family transcriptional regulator [unclassified Inquilinus]|uniref:MucR family transcriptional regulator n=1 Tax=unclassified Inquilinus TaxID=2645927 RepID=UPI003F92D504
MSELGSIAQNANTDEARRLTAQIVSAHVAHNNVAQTDLPALIAQVYGALTGLGRAAEPEAPSRPEPAVSIRKSVTPEFLICLEDGKKLKMLKRHLSSAYGMTPDQYRERWGLPAEYPMVAPAYALQRSTLAKAIGLGTRRTAPVPMPAPAKAPRGRKPAVAKKVATA